MIASKSNLGLETNELRDFKIHNLSSHPANPYKGLLYYNTTQNLLYWYNGSSWINLYTSDRAYKGKKTIEDIDSFTLGAGIYDVQGDRTIKGESSSFWTVLVGEYNVGTGQTSSTQLWIPYQYGNNKKAKLFIRRRKGENDWTEYEEVITTNYLSKDNIDNINHNKGYFETFSSLALIIGKKGDYALVGDRKTIFIWDPTQNSWISIINSTSAGSGAVSSVNGKSGVVDLTKSDIGLANVDNTSDTNKPISNSTQLALDNKVSKTGDTINGILKFIVESNNPKSSQLLFEEKDFKGEQFSIYTNMSGNDDDNKLIIASSTKVKNEPVLEDKLILHAKTGTLKLLGNVANTGLNTGTLQVIGGASISDNLFINENLTTTKEIKTSQGILNFSNKVSIQYNNVTNSLDFVWNR